MSCGPFKILKKINEVAFKLYFSYPMKAKVIHDVFHCCLFRPFVQIVFEGMNNLFRPDELKMDIPITK